MLHRYDKDFTGNFFVTGSVLEGWVCDPFMKPGTNAGQIARRAASACGDCKINQGIVIIGCRDIDENGCKPTASIDCKEAVQELNNTWIEGDTSDWFCRSLRRFIQMLSDTCKV